ncbi:hypothetical protein [Deinococcus sonorensis]|uniref:Lipoprotein n=2 Tax=Deinococcus sonorensis TaxID=309891 RepID=A0AAU7U808_9DEIO
MKKLLSLPLLGVLALTACGTGILPPVTRTLDPITLTMPTAFSLASGVLYLNENQFAKVADVLKNASSLTIDGQALFVGVGDLQTLTIYVRTASGSANALDGCTINSNYAVCSGDESAHKVQDLQIIKGQKMALHLAGAALNAAAKNKSAYFGIKVTSGNTFQGDTVTISDAKATVQF